MVTVNLTPLHVLAGVGGLFVLIVVWRLGARKARRAADTARAGARLVSLAGRVLLTAGLLLGAQWLLITYLDNVTLQIVALALPDLLAGYVLTRALTLPALDASHGRGGGRR